MPYAEIRRQRLYYEDSGGDKPAVAFSHGFMMDHSMFDAQVEALRDRYRCITWDERGHGLTGDATEPFTYWDSADDLYELLRSLGIHQAVLAGMSQGGFLSMRAAIAHPDMVRALVLIDTQAGTENPELMPYYQGLVQRWVTDGMDDELATTIAGIIIGQGYDGTERWKDSWYKLGSDNVLQIFSTLAGRDDLHPRLSEIHVPAVVVHGEQDIAITIELAQRLSHGIQDASLTLIPGAGHASNMTHPELVNPAIEQFLAGLN
jgi:pimeloyl-ACP methyl ester carboxylesterase